MRRVSPKRQALNDQVRDFRVSLVERVGRCEICGTHPKDRTNRTLADLKRLCVHEIANGPHRSKALDKPFAVLVLCWQCNGEKVTDKKLIPEARQLAFLKASRPSDYDLVAYNQLVNPRAPKRIEEWEVAKYQTSSL